MADAARDGAEKDETRLSSREGGVRFPTKRENDVLKKVQSRQYSL